jgi:hypothetical protein
VVSNSVVFNLFTGPFSAVQTIHRLSAELISILQDLFPRSFLIRNVTQNSILNSYGAMNNQNSKMI